MFYSLTRIFSLLFDSICNQYVKPMDFQEEVRAQRDLDSFLAQATILLNEKAATLDEVLRNMLTNMMKDDLGRCNMDAIMSSLFTDARGTEFNGKQNH